MAISTNTYEENKRDYPKLQDRAPTSVSHDTKKLEEFNIDSPKFTRQWVFVTLEFSDEVLQRPSPVGLQS